MDEQARKIEAVITTLEQLDIKATYNNMSKLLGCLQTLAGVRDWIRGEADHGDDHAE